MNPTKHKHNYRTHTHKKTITCTGTKSDNHAHETGGRGNRDQKERVDRKELNETGKGNSTGSNSFTPDVFVNLSSERADSASHNQDG